MVVSSPWPGKTIVVVGEDEEPAIEAVHDLGEARVVPPGRTRTTGEERVAREELRRHNEAARPGRVARRVLGAEPKPAHGYLLPVGQGDVGRHLGDLGVGGVHPERDAERFPHLIDGADMVEVTVGGEDGADRPTRCSLEDRRTLRWRRR